jgi:hypothetical protein
VSDLGGGTLDRASSPMRWGSTPPLGPLVWSQLALNTAAGWGDFSAYFGPYVDCRYAVDAQGMVHLEGTPVWRAPAAVAPTNAQPIAMPLPVLPTPAGFARAFGSQHCGYAAGGFGYCRVNVDADGRLWLVESSIAANRNDFYLSLCGIAYPSA